MGRKEQIVQYLMKKQAYTSDSAISRSELAANFSLSPNYIAELITKLVTTGLVIRELRPEQRTKNPTKVSYVYVDFSYYIK